MARKSRRNRRSQGYPRAARNIPAPPAKPSLLLNTAAPLKSSFLDISASASNPIDSKPDLPAQSPDSPEHLRNAQERLERALRYMMLTGKNPFAQTLSTPTAERSLELHDAGAPDPSVPADPSGNPDDPHPPSPRERKYLALKRDIRSLVQEITRAFPDPNLFEAIQLKKLRAACLMMTEIERSTPGFPIIHPEASQDPQIRRAYIAHRRDFERAAAALLRRADRRESYKLRALNPRHQISLYKPDPTHPAPPTPPSTSPPPETSPRQVPPPAPIPNDRAAAPDHPSNPPRTSSVPPSLHTHQHPEKKQLASSFMPRHAVDSMPFNRITDPTPGLMAANHAPPPR